MARMVLGNPVTSLDVRHSRTRLEIDTSTSHGTLGEEHVLDGERRSKANSGEQVLAKAWEDENGAVVVETTWPKRGITTLDTRELDTRTRLRQVRVCFRSACRTAPLRCSRTARYPSFCASRYAGLREVVRPRDSGLFLALQTTAVLKDGEQVHQAVIVYDKVEDPDEREAAEAAEERAREATALRWASLGIVASAPDEGRAALSSHVAATSGHAGDVPTEDEAAAARRLLAVTEALPRDRWDQSGSWTLDRKESGDPMPVLAAIGVPCEPGAPPRADRSPALLRRPPRGFTATPFPPLSPFPSRRAAPGHGREPQRHDGDGSPPRGPPHARGARGGGDGAVGPRGRGAR